MRLVRILLFLACGTLFAEEAATKDFFAIYLSWQEEDPTTSMIIKWITPLESKQTQLHYKASHDTSWKAVQGLAAPFPHDEPYALHTVILTNLTPKTTYSFHIEGEESGHLFTTLPKDLSDPVSCIIGGDVNLSNTTLYRETTLQAAQLNPAFIIMGGDLACPFPKKHALEDPHKWLTFLKIWYETARNQERLIPLVPVIGNHDIRGGYDKPFENACYFSFLFLAEREKSYSVLHLGNYASFYLLDSGHAASPGGDQAAWLAQELRKDENILHRIAIYHVSAYPPVRDYNNPRSSAVRKAWAPLFDLHRLHLAFENHDHAYKRTYPLTDSQPDPHGVVYLGNGSWGVKPRSPKKPFHTLYLEKTSQIRGFCLLQLEAEKRTVFAVGCDGVLIDSFSQPIDKIAARERLLKDFNIWKKHLKTRLG